MPIGVGGRLLQEIEQSIEDPSPFAAALAEAPASPEHPVRHERRSCTPPSTPGKAMRARSGSQKPKSPHHLSLQIKSPPHQSLNLSVSKPSVRLNLPPGSPGTPGSGPGSARRPRGMSAVRKFEQEYVQSGFYADYAEKTSKADKSKAPLPSIVDLFAQVKELKAENLARKKNESELLLEKEELQHRLKSTEWTCEQLLHKAFRDLMLQELRIRESIEMGAQEVRHALAIAMTATEPEPPVMHSISNYTAQRDRETKKEMDHLRDMLSRETAARQTLEHRLMEDGCEINFTSKEMEQANLLEVMKKVQLLQAELVQKDAQMSRQSAAQAEVESKVSFLETDILRKESEIRLLNTELKEARSATTDLMEMKKRLLDAHRRLQEAEERARRQESEAQATIAAYTDPTSPSRAVHVLALAKAINPLDSVIAPKSPPPQQSPRRSARTATTVSPRRIVANGVMPAKKHTTRDTR